MSSLFRREVFQAQQNRWTGRIVLVRPFSLVFLSGCAAAFAAALLLFAFFGSYTRKTTVTGQLLPEHGLVRVYPPATGIITARHVAAGDFVRAGDVLFTLSTAGDDGQGSIEARLAAEAQWKLELAQQEIAQQKRINRHTLDAQRQTVNRLNSQISQVQNQIAAQKRRIALAEEMLAKQRYLAREGAVSELEAKQQEHTLLALNSELAAYRREAAALAREAAVQQSSLNSLPGQQEQEIGRLERAAAAYRQEVLDYRARGGQTVRAAVSGHVATVNAEIGERADASKLLLSIVPEEGSLLAVLPVPSRAAGFVQPQDQVFLRYQAYPHQKFGHAEGRVVSVAPTALGRQELAGLGEVSAALSGNEPVYLVTVRPEKQTLRVYGVEKKLPVGMVLEADILHERKRLYEWMLEPLYGVAGRWH